MSLPGYGRSVLAAMSGGVDSSTMAALLVEAGYEVVGVTMELLHGVDAMDEEARLAARQDAQNAREACRALGIPHRTIDLSEEFRWQVVEPFCRSYLEGRTPNPCIECNRHLKLAALQRLRRDLGCDYVATGHYARAGFDEAVGRWALRRAADAAKDQSYVLFPASQDDLAHLLLPLGDLTKDQVRALAARRGLASANRPESQDICFVPNGDYVAFIERQAALTELAAPGEAAAPTTKWAEDAQPSCAPLRPRALEPGPIVDGQGRVIGTHQGIARYTIGQRKGLGVAAAEPLYVCAKDMAAGALVVGPAREAMGRRATAQKVNWVSVAGLAEPTRVTAKTHYRQHPQPAMAWQPEPGALAVEFDEPQRLAAPGQALVIYEGDRVLAGGTVVDAVGRG